MNPFKPASYKNARLWFCITWAILFIMYSQLSGYPNSRCLLLFRVTCHQWSMCHSWKTLLSFFPHHVCYEDAQLSAG